jgi:hypothetical protein
VWLALCAIPVPGLAGTGDIEDPWEKKTGEWFEPIESGGTVRVVNPHGDIYARFGGYENRVEILATIQAFESSAPGLVVDRTPSGGGLEVTVRPADAGDPADPPRPFEGKDRVDLVLFVPLGAKLETRTEAGKIEVKGFRGDLDASTIEGDVRIRSVEGRVRATTDRGSISAALETGVTKETQEFVTKTGEIEIHLWEDADNDVDILTSGEISTDFSMRIEHRRFEEPGKHAVAVVGDGGPQINLRSKRGRVRLLRLQKFFQPDTSSKETK